MQGEECEGDWHLNEEDMQQRAAQQAGGLFFVSVIDAPLH
jgi:hypothetical protein